MIGLPLSTAAWDAEDLAAVLKRELESLRPAELALEQALSTTSVPLDEPITVILIGLDREADRLRARLGIFFSGLVAGCSCADDPTPVEPQPEYGEALLVLDRATALASLDWL